MGSWLKTFSAVLVAALIAVACYVGYQQMRDRERAALAEWTRLASSATRNLRDYPSDRDTYETAKSLLARAPGGADRSDLVATISWHESRMREAQPEWDARADRVVQALDIIVKRYQKANSRERDELQDAIRDVTAEAYTVMANKGTPSGPLGVEAAYARLVRAMNP